MKKKIIAVLAIATFMAGSTIVAAKVAGTFSGSNGTSLTTSGLYLNGNYLAVSLNAMTYSVGSQKIETEIQKKGLIFWSEVSTKTISLNNSQVINVYTLTTGKNYRAIFTCNSANCKADYELYEA